MKYTIKKIRKILKIKIPKLYSEAEVRYVLKRSQGFGMSGLPWFSWANFYAYFGAFIFWGMIIENILGI